MSKNPVSVKRSCPVTATQQTVYVYQLADPSGEGGDLILRGVNGDADDAEGLFPIGDAHPPDDVPAVFVQDIVQRLDRVGVFNDDADDGDPCLHGFSSSW